MTPQSPCKSVSYLLLKRMSSQDAAIQMQSLTKPSHDELPNHGKAKSEQTCLRQGSRGRWGKICLRACQLGFKWLGMYSAGMVHEVHCIIQCQSSGRLHNFLDIQAMIWASAVDSLEIWQDCWDLLFNTCPRMQDTCAQQTHKTDYPKLAALVLLLKGCGNSFGCIGTGMSTFVFYPKGGKYQGQI